jgi:putative aldouronate transport system permease protein
MLYRTTAQRIFSVFNYAFLLVVSLICLLPFVNMLAVSFSSAAPVAAGKVFFWPVDFTLDSYKYALTSGQFLRSLWISLQRVVLGVSIQMVLMILTAYPLSKPKAQLTGRNIYMGIFVFTMIFNGGMIPTYMVMVQLRLLNTIWGLVLPGAIPVLNMIILMNFIRQLPDELHEAAAIDGAGPVRTLATIILPLLTPSLATVGLFNIVNHWNDWFSGLIYMQNYLDYPLQTYMHTLLEGFERAMRQSGTDYRQLVGLINARTGRAAVMFLGAVPILLVYPYMQKYFTTGLVMGSVKG